MPSKVPDDILDLRMDMSNAAALRPNHAISAAHIFAMWANVEFLLEVAASVLLGDAAAQIILDQIKNKNQKLQALQKAASEVIQDEETRKLLKPLFRLLDQAAAPRNALAHSLWGVIDSLPDALLLCEPTAMVRATRSLLRAQGGGGLTAESPELTTFTKDAKLGVVGTDKFVEDIRNNTEVWELKDFERPTLLCGAAIAALTLFAQVISGEPDDPATVQARMHLTKHLEDSAKLYEPTR